MNFTFVTMKPFLAAIFILLNALSFAQTTAHNRNTSLAKGVNLSGWLEPQGAPNPTRFVKDDFYDFAEAGFSTVRMPVRFAQYLDTVAPYHLDTTALAFALMDSVISWSRELGLHVIIDNHHGWETLGNSNYLDIIPRMGAMWRQLAQRYQHLNPDSAFFEIINEPSYFLADQPYIDFTQAMIDTIRQQTTDHTIIVSVPWASSQIGFNYITPFADSNLIYTFHFYTPLNFTHQGATWTPIPFPVGRPFPENGNEASVISQFNLANDWVAQYQKPVFLGEFGVIAYADSASRCNWISLIGSMIYSANFSWAYWDWDSPGDINFGFFNGMDASPENIVPCFGEALRLYGMKPSSVQEPADVSFSLFPNPSADVVTVMLNDNKLNNAATITLYNSMGQLIRAFPIAANSASINISSLPPGFYVAALSAEGISIANVKMLIVK